MGLLRRHSRLILSYVALAGVGVFAGHDVAVAANATRDPHAFTITSTNVTGILPGKPLTFRAVLSNPSSQPMKLLTLSTKITLLANPPAPKGAPPCDASKLAVTPYAWNTRGAPQYVVPAGRTASVPLTITLTDTRTNQNGCKGRKFSLTYSGTAEQTH